MHGGGDYEEIDRLAGAFVRCGGPGAGLSIQGDFAASPGDGYTLMMGHVSEIGLKLD